MTETAAPAPAGGALPPIRRYHFHLPGVMYVAVTLFLALGAVNSQNNLLFCALGLAIGGLLVSGILSGASLMGLRLTRSVPGHGSVGHPLTIRYAIANHNRLFPAFGLTVEELPLAADGRRPTWPRHLPKPTAFAVGVPAGRVARIEATVTPTTRGRAVLTATRASTTFPFGLARKSITFFQQQSVVILPPELPLRPGVIDRLTAKAPYGFGGERTPGLGDEFFGLREYVPGDSPRRIAWRRTARTGELVVRQNTTPSPLRLWVVIRAGRSDEPPPSTPSTPARSAAALDERAIALAAAILRNAFDLDVAVGLAIPCARVLQPPRLGRMHLDRLLTELALVDLSAPAEEAAGFPEVAARSGACVVVHARAIDPGYGPRHAAHLAADALERLIVTSAATERLVALLDAATPAATRGWSFLRRAAA